MGEERTNQEWIEDNNDKIDEIKAKVNNLPDCSNLKDLMTVTGTGENVILEETAEELEYVVPPLPIGNTVQDGEPTPTNPVEVQVVKGDIEVDIENKNFFDFSDTIITTPKTYKANLIQVIKLEKGKYYTPHLKYTKELYKNDNWVSENGFGAIVLFKSDTILSDELSYDGVYSGSDVLLKNEASTVDGNTIFQATTNYLLVYAVAVNFQNRFTIGECSLNKTEDNIKDLTYIPHKEQKLPLTLGNIELCKIEDYKDKFEKDNGVWKIPNKILKIDSYNGETITTPYISSTGGLDIGATVYYVGDNALEITDTTLINQLEAIYHDTMSYAKTYINGSSEGLDPLFDVKAYRNTKSIWEDIWG